MTAASAEATIVMTIAAPVPLRAYWEMLSRHDWTHPYSDDHSVWERGNDELKRLQSIAKQSPEHAALFDAMEAHGWHRGPLPPQPEAEGAAMPVQVPRFLEFVNAKTGEVGRRIDVTDCSDHNRQKCRQGMLRNIGPDWFVRDTGDDEAESEDTAA